MVSAPKDVEVLTGPPGCGKSTRLREDAINAPGLYVFFLPTIPLIDEQVSLFRSEAPRIALHEAHSGKGRGTVQRKLDDAHAAVIASGTNHAVIFTTHDALIMRDLSAFRDWHARIDEAPNAVQSGVIPMGKSRPFFEATFDLTPIEAEKETALLSLKGAAPNWPEIADDKLLKSIGNFIKLANSPSGLFVEAQDWRSVDRLKWWSIWIPSALKHFDTVQIAGASYHSSLGAIITRKWFSGLVRLTDTPIPMHRAGPRPVIRIHYFTKGHRPSSALWEKSEGRRMIVRVCDFLAQRVPDLGFWSGNKEVMKLMEWRLEGELVKPRVLGINKLRTLTKCALVYSSGATEDDRPFMDTFEITDAEVRRAREDEDILQFAMRGAIRNADYAGPYDIYLYTEEQAERLAGHLNASDVGSVQIVPEPDAGIMDETPTCAEETEQEGVVADGVPGRRSRTKSPPQKVFNPATGKMVFPRSLKRGEQRATNAQGKPRKRRGRPTKRTSTN